VFARCRPQLARENGDLEAVLMKEDGTVSTRASVDPVEHMLSGKKSDVDIPQALERQFHLDGAFSMDATQKEVFQQVGLPVLVEVMKGFNGCVFAYGQTGSGKTHSLLNTEVNDMNQVGLLPRVVATLFVRAAMDKSYVYSIKASGFQVYNEQVDDLLHPNHNQGQGINLAVKNGGVIPDLSWVECKTANEMLDIFKTARNGLCYAETKMNKSSSRSHAVFQIQITRRARAVSSTNSVNGSEIQKLQATCGQLSIVDLAGSERVKRSGVTGNSFKETTNINGSLLALGNVIQSLADKKKHVPFRDSKLTRILEGSVGGNCKTTLLVCISPAETSLSETRSTLEFASRALRVEVNASVNETFVEIDAKSLAEDMADDTSMRYVDEEMMKTYKESEQALKAARAHAEEHENIANSIKSKLSATEAQLLDKEKALRLAESDNKSASIMLDQSKRAMNELKSSFELKHLESRKALLESQQQFSKTQNQMQLIEQENKSLSSNLKSLRTENESVRSQLIKLESSSQETISSLEIELRDSKESRLELRKEFKNLIDSLTQETIELKSEASKNCDQHETDQITLKEMGIELENLRHELKILDSVSSEFEIQKKDLFLEREISQKYQNELNKMQEEYRVTLNELEAKSEALKQMEKDQEVSRSEMLSILDLVEHKTHLQLQTSQENENLKINVSKIRFDLEDLTNQMQNAKVASESEKVSREAHFESKIGHLTMQFENDLGTLKIKHKEEIQKMELHAKEAVQALEIRAQHEHEKMTEKIGGMNRSASLMKEKFIEDLKAVESKVQDDLVHEKRRQMQLYDEMRSTLQSEIEGHMEALEDIKLYNKEQTILRDQMHRLKLVRNTAMHQAVAVSLEKKIADATSKYSVLNARFMARESRPEDVENSKQQHRRIQKMELDAKKIQQKLLKKETELDHFVQNLRIFGNEKSNKADPKLPGLRFRETNRSKIIPRASETRPNSRTENIPTVKVEFARHKTGISDNRPRSRTETSHYVEASPGNNVDDTWDRKPLPPTPSRF